MKILVMHSEEEGVEEICVVACEIPAVRRYELSVSRSNGNNEEAVSMKMATCPPWRWMMKCCSVMRAMR